MAPSPYDPSIPFLTDVTAKSVEAWRQSVEAYIARGGDKHPKTLIASTVWETLELAVVLDKDAKFAELSPEDLLDAISSIHAPVSKAAGVTLLEGTKCPPTISLDNSLKFVKDFKRRLKIVQQLNLSSKIICRAFIQALQPASLQQAVRVEEPSDFQQCLSHLMEHTRRIVTAQAETGQSSPAPTGSFKQERRGQPALPTPVKKQDKPFSSAKIRCDGCGHEGHRRPQCPHKDKE